mgnify:CR=1 FL=1
MPVTAKLPDALGQSVYTATVTIAGSAPAGGCPTENGYKLQFAWLNGSNQTLDVQTREWNPWNKVGFLCRVSQQDWALSIATTAKPASLHLTLLPSGYPTYTTSLLLDNVEWMRPVALNFGGWGAEFWTPAGAWSFTLSNLPARIVEARLRLRLRACSGSENDVVTLLFVNPDGDRRPERWSYRLGTSGLPGLLPGAWTEGAVEDRKSVV